MHHRGPQGGLGELPHSDPLPPNRSGRMSECPPLDLHQSSRIPAVHRRHAYVARTWVRLGIPAGTGFARRPLQQVGRLHTGRTGRNRGKLGRDGNKSDVSDGMPWTRRNYIRPEPRPHGERCNAFGKNPHPTRSTWLLGERMLRRRTGLLILHRHRKLARR